MRSAGSNDCHAQASMRGAFCTTVTNAVGAFEPQSLVAAVPRVTNIKTATTRVTARIARTIAGRSRGTTTAGNGTRAAWILASASFNISQFGQTHKSTSYEEASPQS